MGYYMGDYYGNGSYYRGDPFWGFLGRVAKTAVSAITGLTRGAPAAAGRAAGVRGAIESAGKIVTTTGAAVGKMVAKHPVLSAAGAAAVLAGGAGVEAGHLMSAPGPGMRGFHIEKRGKHAGQWIKNRHMRVTNPKALRRAIRRTRGFAKLAMRTIHLVHPQKRARFGGFKKKRARR